MYVTFLGESHETPAKTAKAAQKTPVRLRIRDNEPYACYG